MVERSSRRRTRISDPFRFDQDLLADAVGAAVSGRGGSGADDLQGGDGNPGGSAGDLRLAGADEAGRGCLAGPLVAAAVVLDYAAAPFPALRGLTDSKLLTPEAREGLYQGVLRSAARVSWATCSPGTIDRDGLHPCNLGALSRALQSLDREYALAVVDGFELSLPELRVRSLVGADYKSAAVAAASVVAKVVRDRLMRTLAPRYPEYGFAEHVGYGTDRHREALKKHGPCALHRLSFQGVATPQLGLWEE